MSFLNKLFKANKGVVDVVSGKNGIISLLKDGTKPTSKISSKRSAASALIISAIYMTNQELIWERLALIGLFALCGTFLLWASARYHQKI